MTDSATLARPPSASTLLADAIADHQAGRLDAAIAGYGRVLAVEPRNRSAANNMGVALRTLGLRDAAEACYRRVLTVTPDDPATHVNLGNVLRDVGRLDEAEAAHRRALDLDPASRGAAYGLGLVFRDAKRLDESLHWLSKAVAADPANPDINWDLAQTLLCQGDYPAGWAQYEWRWKLKGVTRPPYGRPDWDGTPLSGRTLLLHGEQGFGDVIQFARFAPLAARGGTVILHVRPELVALLDGQLPGVAQVVPVTRPPPPCDVVAPLLSVPHLLGLARDDIPRGPTLRPVPRPIALPAPPPGTRLKVALCWQGSPTQKNDRNRSLPLAALLPLLRHPDIAFYSVQKGEAAKDLVRHGVAGLVPNLDPVLNDFADSSAVLGAMDLVITADTSVLHVAAAMGKPAWVLLSTFHDWRFDGRDSIDTWYSSVRVFKQATPGDWRDPVRRVDEALASILGGAG